MIRLLLLGGFELRNNGHVVALAPGAQRVVAFLGITRGSVLRSRLAGNLWPDKPEERAAGNLRNLLWKINPPGLQLVCLAGSSVVLSPSVSVDVLEMVEVARSAMIEADELDDAIDVNVLAADLLPDWYDEWIVIERERLRQLRLHALEALCARLAAAGRFGEAVEAGLLAVADEPLRESAHTVLIRAYLAEGNRSDALRQYRQFRQLLLSELGVEPSPSLTRMVQTLAPAVTLA